MERKRTESYLIEEIIAVTKDPKSRPFLLKAVRVLGEHIVAEEFGELKYQMNVGGVRNPAKYLTALLKRQMNKHETAKGKEQRRQEPKKLTTYFESTQVALFSNLQPQEPSGETEEKAMEVPYGKDTIPWATFVSSSFFTLSTNKAKSDVVQAKFRTMDGDVSVVSLIRGRMKPGGRERGIPTAEHGRVLAAIKNIWAQQGCQYDRDQNGMVVCFCRVSIRELSQLLGRSKFGGKDLVELTDKVGDLKSMWYYLDLSGLGLGGMKGYGFTLLSKIDLVEGKRRGQPETVLRVDFSTPLSTQLLNRHAVTRPMELAQIQSELGFLLRLYLEPILLGMKSPVFSKQLKDLIAELALPPAGWHGLKDKRKRMFLKAIYSMKSQMTADGREILLSVENGLFDWMLMARLGPAAAADASGQASPRQVSSRDKELIDGLLKLFNSEEVSAKEADYVLEAIMYTKVLGECLFEKDPANKERKALANQIIGVLTDLNASKQEAEAAVRGARMLIRKTGIEMGEGKQS